MKQIFALFVFAFALPAAHADLFVSNTFIDFYDTPVNSYGKSSSLYVQNLNHQAVQVTVSSSCFGDFQLTNMCNLSLSENDLCGIDIRFQPRQFGQQSCTITVSDSLGESAFINVSGRGVRND